MEAPERTSNTQRCYFYRYVEQAVEQTSVDDLRRHDIDVTLWHILYVTEQSQKHTFMMIS